MNKQEEDFLDQFVQQQFNKWEDYALIYSQSTHYHLECFENLSYLLQVFFEELFNNSKKESFADFSKEVILVASSCSYYRLNSAIKKFFNKLIKKMLIEMEDFEYYWICSNLIQAKNIIETNFC